MKKITAKLILVSIGILMISPLIPNIILEILGERVERPIDTSEDLTALMLFIGITTGFFVIFLYGVAVNRILLRRVKELNKVTKNVMDGNYDSHIEEKGKDEISILIQNFNMMTQELKNNEYINKEFVRNFSHELKTPLSAIKGYGELLINPEISESEKQEYTNIIIDEASRL